MKNYKIINRYKKFAESNNYDSKIRTIQFRLQKRERKQYQTLAEVSEKKQVLKEITSLGMLDPKIAIYSLNFQYQC